MISPKSNFTIIFLLFFHSLSYTQLDEQVEKNIGLVISREINTFYELINLSIASSASVEYHNDIIAVAKEMTYRKDSRSVFQFSINEDLSPLPYSIDSLANIKSKYMLKELRFETDVFFETMSLGYYLPSSEAYPAVRTIVLETSLALNSNGKYITSEKQKTAVLRVYKNNGKWEIKIVSIRDSYEKEKIKGEPTIVMETIRDIIEDNKIREFELSDFDLDGVINKYDKCPNTPGTLEYKGCPRPEVNIKSKASLFVPGFSSVIANGSSEIAFPIISYTMIGLSIYEYNQSGFENAISYMSIALSTIAVDYLNSFNIYKRKNRANEILKGQDKRLGSIDTISIKPTGLGIGIIVDF